MRSVFERGPECIEKVGGSLLAGPRVVVAVEKSPLQVLRKRYPSAAIIGPSPKIKNSFGDGPPARRAAGSRKHSSGMPESVGRLSLSVGNHSGTTSH